MDLLAALDIIRNAPDESLHIYATQTISTLKLIEKRLQHFLPANSPIVVDSPASIEFARSQSPANAEVPCSLYNHFLSPPERPTSPASQNDHRVSHSPHASPQGSPGTGISSTTASSNHTTTNLEPLLDGIKNHTYWLLAAKELEDDAIIPHNRSSEDIRLEDIRRAEGARVSDQQSKIRRVLALRSLATEYDKDQAEKRISPTRLEELCAYVSSPETSTLNLKANHTVKDSFETKALNSGLRHLTIERTLNARLKSDGLPGSYEAISAVLALNIHNFRCLRYQDFSAVLDEVKSMQVPVSRKKRKRSRKTTDERTTPLLPLLQDLSQWFGRLQEKYEVTDDAGIPPDIFDEILAQPANICALSSDTFNFDDICSWDTRHLPFAMRWD
ncbi:hypothetical protein N7468_004171 [Penicillium chermesinum]|uniref:Uncharacterized protein n=1 Tax=Penicillium chermesinum TaxID=63820 RepID=A0A9W9P836_9EURO|nr:uncharacterized protein N7468_004171 [Penicillium chermesinum]KAJ5239552.1 hypothetical protein N7468_004171 [Penicillium chermesinum]